LKERGKTKGKFGIHSSLERLQFENENIVETFSSQQNGFLQGPDENITNPRNKTLTHVFSAKGCPEQRPQSYLWQ
jgi:hypothetical protein